MPRIGRLGKTLLASVTFTQFAWLASSGAKVEANLHVAIVSPDDGDALILR